MTSRAWVVTPILLVVAAPAAADDYHVHASGDIWCNDNGVLAPLAGARVELMDSDADGSTIFDDTMDTKHTDANGHFELDGQGGDPGSAWWSKPDVYVRVSLVDDSAFLMQLTDELGGPRSWDSPEHDHDNVEGNVGIGSFSWGTDASTDRDHSSQCGVWLKGRQVYQDFLALTGNNVPPFHYDIEYWSGVVSGTPWTNLDTTHWPIHYHSGATKHEFGHAARHSSDGNNDEFNLDVVRFIYAQYHPHHCDTHNEGFAFNEGWAEYWSEAFEDCGRPAGPYHSHVEADVARFLKYVETCVGGRGGLMQVLRENPGAIHSIDDMRKALKKHDPVGCGWVDNVGTSNEGLTTASPPTIAFPTAAASIAALDADAKAAAQKADQLTEIADKARTCAGVEACHTATQAILDAVSWRVHQKLVELATERLRTEVSSADTIVAQLKEGTFNRWYADAKATYMTNVQNVTLAGLRAAATKVALLAQHSPDAAMFVAPLQAKVERAEAAIAAGKAIPSADPLLAGGADASATIRVPINTPGKVPVGCHCDAGSTPWWEGWPALALLVLVRRARRSR
jgi:transthyretin-like family protein